MGRMMEFSKATRQAAWDRSGERCEASGKLYGFPPGVRCNADLNLGVEYDHVNPEANSKDSSLENCCAACPKCHHYKTHKIDKPRISKTTRLLEKRRNLRGRKHDWGKRPFSRESRSNTRDIHEDLATDA